MPSPFESPVTVGRAVFITATVVFGVLGLMLTSPGLLAASAACGVAWTMWDVLWDRVLGPFGDWAFRAFTEGVSGGAAPNTRPTLDDTIRLLEHHLAHGASRGVQVQAAVRLEEIYRSVRHEPERARALIRRVRERYPDAEEWAYYDADGAPRGGSEPGPPL